MTQHTAESRFALARDADEAIDRADEAKQLAFAALDEGQEHLRTAENVDDVTVTGLVTRELNYRRAAHQLRKAAAQLDEAAETALFAAELAGYVS